MGTLNNPGTVLLTIAGAAGQFINNGLIRGGEGYRLGSNWNATDVIEPGGGVIIRGQPIGWNPSFPSGPCAALEVINNGTLRGGDSGSGGVFGGSIVIGWSPFLNDQDWPYLPFALIENHGLIRTGQGSGGMDMPIPWTSGNVVLLSANWFDAVNIPWGSAFWCQGGFITGDGGQIQVGAGGIPGYSVVSVADEQSYTGPGTSIFNACNLQVVGWVDDWMVWWWYPGNWFSFRDLDVDAMYTVPPGPGAGQEQLGGSILAWSNNLDLQNNDAGTVVMRADPGTQFQGDIWLWGNVLLDPGVTVPDITEPDAQGWTRKRGALPGVTDFTGAIAARDTLYSPLISLQPLLAYDDTNLVDVPGYGMASPGDTILVRMMVMVNQDLGGDIYITATDSLGYYILGAYQTVPAAFTAQVPEIEFGIRVPNYADFGTKDRLDITATWSEDSSVRYDLSLYLHVVPTVNVIAPFYLDWSDTLFTPGTVIYYDFLVRNEDQQGAHLLFSAGDTEGWEIHTEYSSAWISARSDTIYPVHVTIPYAAHAGAVDTVYVLVEEVGKSDNADETGVIVTVPEVSGVEPALPPSRLALRQNVPNPFNPTTSITFELPGQMAVSLRVYDISGRLVRNLIDDKIFGQGNGAVTWNACDSHGNLMPSGTYFYRLEVGDYVETKKMTLLK